MTIFFMKTVYLLWGLVILYKKFSYVKFFIQNSKKTFFFERRYVRLPVLKVGIELAGINVNRKKSWIF